MSSAHARRVEVPPAIGADEEFAGSDYASAFELAVPEAGFRTPEQWARAVFEGAPLVLRWMVTLGWTVVLRLRLGPRRSPEHILGWRIADSGAGSITLTSRSRLITAHNVVVVRDSSVVWVTFVRFDRRIARPVWAVVAPVHHLTIPYLLRRAHRSRAGG
ncbi:DUF2867 domain-containing protein [Embleya sp. NBC_00896]|uniref:DUF2867 domain-containing protein n=1 Tax=Embleya sp. NBC_00896 TaxID=2975961 RepID=UPI002F911334|nr:DUF2867 domain-containing protein [Embleya sp. NBC_00896]